MIKFSSAVIVLVLTLWAASEPNDKFQYNRNGHDFVNANQELDDELNRD